jgi:hypothetical protein
MMKALLATGATFVFAASASAALSATSLGMASPVGQAATAGMAAAIADPGAVFADVTSAPLTAGKSVLFSTPLSHRRIGSGWATWSHGYTGDVYYTNGATSVTMTFSQSDISGFYFYVESNPFGPFTATVSAVGTGGATATATGTGDGGSGATGFAISATGGTKIVSITVSMGPDFAIGEFGWAKTVPAPGALALFGLAGLAGRRRRA